MVIQVWLEWSGVDGIVTRGYINYSCPDSVERM